MSDQFGGEIHYAESWSLCPELQRRFLSLGTFVESGTYTGGGVAQALRLGFTKIHTIELDRRRFAKAASRFANDSQVTCWHGDSGELLPEILADISNPALLFLDGHDGSNSPLLKELNVISRRGVRHTIIIDDVDLIQGGKHWGKLVDFHDLLAWAVGLQGYQLEVVDSNVRPQSQWLLIPI
jgi:hypothetical protein